METKDLRYGNYITYKGKVFQVNDILGASGLITVLPNEENDRPGRLAVHDFAPIALTEDWLKRFGAKDPFPQEVNSRVLQIGELVVLLESEGRLFCQVDFNEQEGMNIKYVHQLQNLYFALTGQELTVARPE